MTDSNSEERSMDLEMQQMDSMAESLLVEMGMAPDPDEEHPVIARFRSQLEEGLTPEEVVGAAAVVHAMRQKKQVMIQSRDKDTRHLMMTKDGQWMGKDINETEPGKPANFQYGPDNFPTPEEGLKMHSRRGSFAESATRRPREESVTSVSSEVPKSKERRQDQARMMTPHAFTMGGEQTSSSESPKPPPLIDSEEERREEARALAEARQRNEELVIEAPDGREVQRGAVGVYPSSRKES